MKLKTTNKAIRSNFSKVFAVGYCDLQHLFHFRIPNAYTSGVYGWNADLYDLGFGTCISTGYRPIGISIDRDLVEKYDKMAKEVVYSDIPYEDKKAKVDGFVLHFRTKLENL